MRRLKKPAERTIVVLGASLKPTRYSYLALTQLAEAGYRVIPVHPKVRRIEGIPVVPSLASIREPVDTLTLYVGPARSAPLIHDMVELAPGRVILNPGTESHPLERALRAASIPFEHACTLVMLRTGQF